MNAQTLLSEVRTPAETKAHQAVSALVSPLIWDCQPF
jgi:hypothetical protein